MTTPRIKVPPGYQLLERDGVFEVVANGATMTHVLTFRVPSAVYVSLIPFIESFPQHNVSTAMRWLLDHETVCEVIRQKVADEARRRRTPKPTAPEPTG